MNVEKLKQLDRAISSHLTENSPNPDCLVGAAIDVIYHGEDVYRKEYGMADKENHVKMAPDSIFRCYSLTKPITSVAVMSLVERGLLQLSDPVSLYLPGFANQTVLTDEGLEPAESAVTIQQLLDMTSGVVYPDTGFPAGAKMQEMIDAYYEKINRGQEQISTVNLANQIGKNPLAFQPGKGWLYGFGADVLGAVIEVVTGKSFGDYLREVIFDPLGMTDTDFYVPKEKQSRLCVNYEYNPRKKTLEPCTWQHLGLAYQYAKKPAFESGGAGLVSTVDDYAKIIKMFLGKGTTAGTRILGRKTVECMAKNHLTKEQMPWFNWEQLKGYGYGNLMRVATDVGALSQLGSEGEFGWDGWLGCYMFVDPKEDLGLLYVIQKCGGNGHRDEQVIRNIVYSALT